MIKNNIKNYLVISLLLLSATSMVQNHASALSFYGQYICGTHECTAQQFALHQAHLSGAQKSGQVAIAIRPSIGAAINFAVLGSSTVTNTGNTNIVGNLGVSSGTAITGFPPGIVIGRTYASDEVATGAHADAATAYGILSNATCTINEPAVADIGGQTLTPGVYCFPSSAAITGTLTLSGSGAYIFKIGSTLTTSAGNSNVVLTSRASSSQVFWAVGSSATLGTGSDFKGTMIAYSSITSTTGATVDGRLIALNGAVTLDTNHITITTLPFH
ncbi:MAG: ice-binding family protein [Nitrosotalea sp.]